MTVPRHITSYALTPQLGVHFTFCGTREFPKAVVLPKRTKACFVAVLVERGQVPYTVFFPFGPQSVTVLPGEVHVVTPFVPHTCTFEAGTKVSWIHFSFWGDPEVRFLEGGDQAVEALYGTRNKVSSQPSWVLPLHMALNRDLEGFVRVHMELLNQVALSGIDDMVCHQLCGYLVSLLHRAYTQAMLRAGQAREGSPMLANVALARSFIRMNFNKKISLAEIADAVHLTPSYLSRCFRKITGERLVDFLLKTRIEAAKSLLAEGSGTHLIKEVAHQTGFSSTIYFCRAFRRLEKQTAGEYAREKNGLNRLP